MPIIDNPDDVFINCPFDEDYKPMFDAIVFAVFDCGFRVRCSKESDDSGAIRIKKISNIVRECRYSIHDISRTELGADNNLPRFNMPLELGVVIGATEFGDTIQRKKKFIILDTEQFRFQEYISDLGGQDIKSHNGDPNEVIKCIRDFLSNESRRKTIPTARTIRQRFTQFQADLPEVIEELNADLADLTFNDFAEIITEWLDQNT